MCRGEGVEDGAINLDVHTGQISECVGVEIEMLAECVGVDLHVRQKREGLSLLAVAAAVASDVAVDAAVDAAAFFACWCSAISCPSASVSRLNDTLRTRLSLPLPLPPSGLPPKGLSGPPTSPPTSGLSPKPRVCAGVFRGVAPKSILSPGTGVAGGVCLASPAAESRPVDDTEAAVESRPVDDTEEAVESLDAAAVFAFRAAAASELRACFAIFRRSLSRTEGFICT